MLTKKNNQAFFFLFFCLKKNHLLFQKILAGQIGGNKNSSRCSDINKTKICGLRTIIAQQKYRGSNL